MSWNREAISSAVAGIHCSFSASSNIVKEQITQFLLGNKLSSNLSTIGLTCSWIVLMLSDGLWSSPTIKVPRQIRQGDPAAFPAAATENFLRLIFSRTVTSCSAEDFYDLVTIFFFFFSFINDFFLLLVNRDKIRGSMSLNFTSALVGFTIWLFWLFFSLELKLHKEWRAFHPYLIFSHSHRLNFRLEYSDTINEVHRFRFGFSITSIASWIYNKISFKSLEANCVF